MELEQINNEFVPHKESLLLKEIGFDKPCFGGYCTDGTFAEPDNELNCFRNRNRSGGEISAPTYRQAFKWFRDTHQLFHEIGIDQTTYPKYDFSITRFIGNPKDLTQKEWGWEKIPNDIDWGLYSQYEKAELACLNKLILLVKEKQTLLDKMDTFGVTAEKDENGKITYWIDNYEKDDSNPIDNNN